MENNLSLTNYFCSTTVNSAHFSIVIKITIKINMLPHHWQKIKHDKLNNKTIKKLLVSYLFILFKKVQIISVKVKKAGVPFIKIINH